VGEESPRFPSPSFCFGFHQIAEDRFLGLKASWICGGTACGKCHLPGERCSEAGSRRGGRLAFSGGGTEILCGKPPWVWVCMWETEVLCLTPRGRPPASFSRNSDSLAAGAGCRAAGITPVAGTPVLL